MKKPAASLGFALSFLLIISMGCSLIDSVINPATPTATTPPPSATATNTPLPPTATITPSASSTPLVTATESLDLAAETATSAAPVGGVTLPFKFNITLSAPATSCGEGVSSEYTVTLTESTITLYQIEYQITSTGPYNPATGAFTSTVSGLPGTETYTGIVTLTPGAGGTVVTMSGQYTYTGDPDWTCSVPDQFSGQATINP